MSARARGRPFEPGRSGNPGGRPKLCFEVRELARAHAAEAIEELARLAVHAKSETARIAAIREVLDLTMMANSSTASRRPSIVEPIELASTAA